MFHQRRHQQVPVAWATAVAVVLMGTAADAGLVAVTTADGNGADVSTRENDPNTNFDAPTWNFVGAKFDKDDPDPARHRNSHIVLRFDLSGVPAFTSGTLNGATLSLIKHRDLGGPGPLHVYGVDDSASGDALADWSETGLTYNNALWLDQDSTFDDYDFESWLTDLGDIATGGVSGDAHTLTGTGLEAFLAADTNNLVTLIVAADMGTIDFYKYASKETTTLEDSGGSGSAGDFAPSLSLDIIPEPSALMLLAAAGGLLLVRRP
jgi:hypothetical protein